VWYAVVVGNEGVMQGEGSYRAELRNPMALASCVYMREDKRDWMRASMSALAEDRTSKVKRMCGMRSVSSTKVGITGEQVMRQPIKISAGKTRENFAGKLNMAVLAPLLASAPFSPATHVAIHG
jgi:hypothetical protein